MNLRYEILSLVKNAGIMPRADLLEELKSKGIGLKRITDNINAAAKDGVISKTLDDGAVAYKLTAKGLTRLSMPPDSKKHSVVRKPKPVVGKNNTGSAQSVAPLESPPAEVRSVEPEGGNGVGSAAPSFSEMALTRVVDDRDKAVSQRDAWRELAERFGADTPEELHQMIFAFESRLKTQANTIKDQDAEIARLEAAVVANPMTVRTLTEECARLKAENTALTTLNESMPGFGAAYKAQEVDRYLTLRNVLERAYSQASTGKGAERHAQDLPFDEQPMQTISQLVGTHQGLLYQAIKKTQESTRLPTDRAIAELLGAINYLAGAVIYLEAEGGLKWTTEPAEL